MSIERAYQCGLYLPGHDVHWIQAKVSAQSAADPRKARSNLWAPGHLLDVRSDGSLVVEVDGAVRRLWNHDPDRLEQLVARNLGEISHQPGFSLIRTKSERGSYLFCVADADSPDLRPCPAHPPTGNPMDLLREADGFSVPGPEALRWSESRREK